MSGSWAATVQAALVAALARPAWWLLALASFLVRGGVVLVAIPILTLPTSAGIANALAPSLQGLILGRPTPESVIAVTLLATAVVAAVIACLLAGAWLEVALLREVTSDEELDLGWSPVHGSAVTALGVRLVAHVPTAFALVYASIRIVEVLYVELTAPGDAGTPLELRVLRQAVGALIALGAAWLVGETIGALAIRRIAAGESVRGAHVRAVVQLVSPRGLATFATTTIALAAVLAPFLLATGRVWQQVRAALLDFAAVEAVLAAVILMVSGWVLGLALLGAVLAWRATAWTVQIAPRTEAVTRAILHASEPSR